MAERPEAPERPVRPATVELACYLLWALVAAGLVVSILVVVYRDRLAQTWAPEPSGDSTVQPVDFVPVILVLYVVIAGTTLTLVPLLRLGHNWARHVLAVISLGIVLATAATVRTSPPTMVRGCAIAAAAIAAVVAVLLWHPDSHRFIRETSAEDDD
ncbi:MAG TPA: hypothetical protein VNS55_13935 [Nocardioides sp.]|nr:hypothetical protein [Nocardioides sp.]